MLLSILFYLIFALYLAACCVLVFVVLIQSGKGGGLSGLVSSSSTLGDRIGATGAEKTLNRWTTYCAVGFILLNIFLVVIGAVIFKPTTILDELPEDIDMPISAPATGDFAAQPPLAVPAPVEATPTPEPVAPEIPAGF